MDERETAAAVGRMKQGDIGGLAVLVRRYQVRAVRAAYLITGDRALAEDVVQAAFVRLFQRIDQYDSSRPFAPYFLRSVANAAVQAAQRRQRNVSLNTTVAGDATLEDLLPDEAPLPETEAQRAELRQAVHEALNKLSPEQRAAVVMRYYLDLSEAEMSDALAVPAGTVKWRLHSARKQLSVLLRRWRLSCPAGES